MGKPIEMDKQYRHNNGSVRRVYGLSIDGTGVAYTIPGGDDRVYKTSVDEFAAWLEGAEVEAEPAVKPEDRPFPRACVFCGQTMYPSTDARHVRHIAWKYERNDSMFYAHGKCWDLLIEASRKMVWPKYEQ